MCGRIAAITTAPSRLALDLLGDLDPDDLARCRSVIGTLEERLDEAVARRVEAFESAPGPQLNPDNPQN
jgi:hypothetical protein